MGKRLVLVLTAVVILAAALALVSSSVVKQPVSAAANLVANPGFELPDTDVNDDPDDWSRSGATSPYRDTGRSGNFSAYIHNSGATYTQDVNTIAVSTVYKFELYSKAGTDTTDTWKIEIFDEGNSLLETYTDSRNGDHGWQRTLRYITTPANAWKATITLKANGTGTAARFDDVVLQEEVSGSCFIATAAHSATDPGVQTLRDFRDRHLMTNPVGRALVSAYYEAAPPVAGFIDEHPALKPVVRVALVPAVALSGVVMGTTTAQKVAILCVFALVISVTALRLRKRTVPGKPVV